jgi:hypothetical protein
MRKNWRQPSQWADSHNLPGGPDSAVRWWAVRFGGAKGEDRGHLTAAVRPCREQRKNRGMAGAGVKFNVARHAARGALQTNRRNRIRGAEHRDTESGVSESPESESQRNDSKTPELLQHQPKSAAAVTVVRSAVVAERTTNADRLVAPGPAPQNTGRPRARSLWIDAR